MSKGIFYGVGVGPGDPELLTLKAVRVLEACPVLAVPQTADGRTLALDIARQGADLAGKRILPLPLAMSRDSRVMDAAHDAAADRVAALLDEGLDVAMPNLGDVSIYATFGYLQGRLKARGYATVMIPGVPSFCAVAAALNCGLTRMNEPLHLIPGGVAETALNLPGTKVLMKPGRDLPGLVARLRAEGRDAALVESCGLPEERIFETLNAYTGDNNYFATLVVKD